MGSVIRCVATMIMFPIPGANVMCAFCYCFSNVFVTPECFVFSISYLTSDLTDIDSHSK